jgi:hypothetical protein
MKNNTFLNDEVFVKAAELVADLMDKYTIDFYTLKGIIDSRDIKKYKEYGLLQNKKDK